MGFPVGVECLEQAQSAVLLIGMGKHCAAVPLYSQQVSIFFFPAPYFILTINYPSQNLSLVPNSLPPGCEFGQADMQKLVPKEEKQSGSTAATAVSGSKKNGKSF